MSSGVMQFTQDPEGTMIKRLHAGLPSERGAVPTNEARAPPPTVGLPLARNGGHAAAQAPVHALCVPESFLNR